MKIASEDDIHQCFRILFEREIGPLELEGHMQFVGSPLHSVLATYMNSQEFRQRGLLRPSHDERPIISEVDGFKIATDPTDVLIGRHILAGNYEPEVAGLIRQHLSPGMTFLDIGANVGFFSLMAASIVGEKGTVIAVEPSPSNVRLLEISRVLNTFEHLEIHAVAADEKMRLLSYSTAFSNGSTNEPTDDIERLMLSQMVPSMTIDQIVGRRRVDICKIDVEGFEHIALRGASSMLKRHKPKIISEFAPDNIKGGPDSYLEYLISLGYQIGVIGTDGSVEDAGTDKDKVIVLSRARMTDHVDLWITASR